MHLRALEAAHARIARQIRHRAHAGGEHQVLGLQRHRLALVLHGDLPLLLRVVPARALALGARPVVELHQLGVALEPIADLVLGAEHRPVVGERQVRQLVVPHRVVQAQALVAVAPAVAGLLVFLDDDRRHAELLEPRAEDDAGLTAADHHHVGLLGEAQRALFVLPRLEPALAVFIGAVLDALRTVLALLFFETFEFLQRGEQRPRLAADQAQVAATATGGGFEREPAFGDAARLAAFALDREIRRLGPRHRRFEHRLDLLRTFGGLDVPGERHQVAPVRIAAEHRGGAAEFAARHRGLEISEPRRNQCGGCAHRLSPEWNPAPAAGRAL